MTQRVNNRILWLITSLKNALIWLFILILKTKNLQQLKGMESSKLGNEKGVPFLNRRYTTGVPFLSIMVYKRVWGWTSEGGLPVVTVVDYPPPPPPPGIAGLTVLGR